MVSTRRGATPQPSQQEAADATQPQPSSSQQQEPQQQQQPALTPPAATPGRKKRVTAASASKLTTTAQKNKKDGDAATAANGTPAASTAQQQQQPAAGQLSGALAAAAERPVASASKPKRAEKAAVASAAAEPPVPSASKPKAAGRAAVAAAAVAAELPVASASKPKAAGKAAVASAAAEPPVASASKPKAAEKAAVAAGGGPRRVLEEEEDDDDILLHVDMAQLAASIQLAVQKQRQAAGPAGGSKVGDAEARAQDDGEQGSSDDEEGDEEEDAAADEAGDEEEGRGRGERAAEGKAANPLKGLRRWTSKVALPKVPAPTRLVHQREPAQAEKEAGISKQLLAPPRDPSAQARATRKSAGNSAGSSWYGMTAPVMNADLKRDLRLLKLRGAFDPKKFYKGFDASKLPKFFQMGTVVDNAVDFYGGRLTNAQRKGTLTEQLLADVQITQARKKRYNKLQQEAQKHSAKVGGKRKADRAPRAPKNVKHKSR